MYIDFELLVSSGCSSTEVVLLDRSDGRGKLVSVARRLAVAVATKQTALCDITPSYVDTALKGESSVTCIF